MSFSGVCFVTQTCMIWHHSNNSNNSGIKSTYLQSTSQELLYYLNIYSNYLSPVFMINVASPAAQYHLSLFYPGSLSTNFNWFAGGKTSFQRENKMFCCHKTIKTAWVLGDRTGGHPDLMFTRVCTLNTFSLKIFAYFTLINCCRKKLRDV